MKTNDIFEELNERIKEIAKCNNRNAIVFKMMKFVLYAKLLRLKIKLKIMAKLTLCILGRWKYTLSLFFVILMICYFWFIFNYYGSK